MFYHTYRIMPNRRRLGRLARCDQGRRRSTINLDRVYEMSSHFRSRSSVVTAIRTSNVAVWIAVLMLTLGRSVVDVVDPPSS